MDHSHIDRLARSLRARRTRRAASGLLSGLLTAPVIFSSNTVARKHKKKHKGKSKGKKKDGVSECTAQPITQTCAGACGSATDNCGSAVTCSCPSGQCCGGDGTCGACLVFVTSTAHNGNLGGLAGADAICQNRAAAARLPGAYKAWLSDSSGSPSTRFIKATAPYLLTNGQILAADWNDLTPVVGAGPDYPINNTETGAEAIGGASNAWTFTDRWGVAGGPQPDSHCGNWTSAANADYGGTGNLVAYSGWTEGYPARCDIEERLYCFQQS